MSTTASGARGGLRRDAERNRQRILRAAAEVFTERGLSATLDDVARQAGVGVGTVYRRFPNKEALAETLFAARFDRLTAMAERALAEPDSYTGLASFLEESAAMMAEDRGMRQILMFATYGRDKADIGRERMQPLVTRLVERAQRDGAVRADLRPTDIPVISFLLATANEYAGQTRPGIWRRYLVLVLDALRPGRETTTELPVAALTPAELTSVMRTVKLGRPW